MGTAQEPDWEAMIQEHFQPLRELIGPLSDFDVPGLDPDQFLASVLWAQEGVDGLYVDCSRPAPSFTQVIRSLAGWYAARAGCRAWILTKLFQSTDFDQFVGAGWARSNVTENANRSHTNLILSIPPSQFSPNWCRFWRVPLDPIFTNMLVMEPLPGVPCPPDSWCGSEFGPASTLLPWPAHDGSSHACSIAEYGERVVMFSLGVMECRLGLQINVRHDRLSEVMQVLRGV